MASRNVESGIRHLFEAFNDQDLEQMVAGYSDDVRFVTGRGEIVGKDNVRQMWTGFIARGLKVQTKIVNIVDGGDEVAYEFLLVGSGDEERDKIMHCDVVTFNAAGQISAEKNYSNTIPPGME